jgi:lipopolysaccharide assembly outer membrane protein LptD (OstA)
VKRITLKSKIICTVLAAAAVVVLIGRVTADEKQQQPRYSEIKYQADTSSYKWDGNDRILALKGNVKFTQGDTALTADKVDYKESTNTAIATGNLKIYDDRNTITGDLCTVNFKEKKGSVTGNVRLLIKPKPEGGKSLKSEWKDDTEVTCALLDYFYKEKRAVVPGALTITQKKRVVTADSGTYFVKDELAKLVGNVKGRDDKNRHNFQAPSVTISLKESDQWVEADKATGSFYVENEEEIAKPDSPDKQDKTDKQPEKKETK